MVDRISPYSDVGLFQFEPPRTLPACRVATLGGSMDGYLLGPEKIITKLRVNSGHASAQQMIRFLANSDEGNVHLLPCADEVSEL